MKESEYLETTALNSVRIAKNIIRNLIPNHTYGINKQDKERVMEIMSDWEIKLSKVVRITE